MKKPLPLAPLPERPPACRGGPAPGPSSPAGPSRTARPIEALLTVKQAAARLSLSTKTVRRLIERDALRVHRIGRSLRISSEDLRLFLAPCRS